MVELLFASVSPPPTLSPGTFEAAHLDEVSDAALDELAFGVIALDTEGTVLRYNQYESRLARLDRNQVVGRNFFREVAPCTRTAEFEGRFQQYVATGAAEAVRFDYVFDFKFGAQDVQVELIRPSSLERYYFLINRTQFRDARPDGVPAPLQRELSPGDAALGVRRDGSEQRLAQLPSSFFGGLRATCDRLAPQTWPIFCEDWGIEWGRRAAIDLEAQFFQKEGKSLNELSMRRIAEILNGWFREQGLGGLVLDFSFASDGCLVIELERSLLVEAVSLRSREIVGGSQEQCHLIGGCLSALLSHIGGRRVVAREFRCGAGHPALCSFLLVAQPKRAPLESLIASGQRDVHALVKALSTRGP